MTTATMRSAESPEFGAAVRRLSLFGFVFAAQLGHLIEHIAKAVSGQGLLGPAADTELTHLLFNGLVAAFALALVWAYPLNPWVYPLALLSVLHGIEHIYIYEQYLRTGLTNGPGLFGVGGAIGVIPLARLDLHNVYNGLEMILIALGAWNEVDLAISEHENNAMQRIFQRVGMQER